MRRLYIGPIRDAARMEFVCGFRLGRGYVCHVRLDGRHRASAHAPVIRRSIWSNLLYCPGPTVGHMYVPELFYLCLYGEVGRAGVSLELPPCLGHVVVGQVRQQCYAWVV